MSRASTSGQIAPPVADAPDVRDFLRDVAATALTRGVTLAAGVVTLTMTTRLLGPEGRGQFAVAMATLSLLLQFFHFGLHSSSTYYLARFPGRRAVVTGLLTVFAFGFVGLVTAAAIWIVFEAPALVPNVPPEVLGLALSAAPPAMFLLLAGNAWLGLGRTAIFNGLDLATRAVGLGSVVLLLWWSVPALFAAYAAGHYLLALWAYWSLAGWTWPRLDAAISREVIQYGWRMFLTSVFMYLVLRQDLFLVNAWLGSAPAGQYSVAVQVSELLLMATASVTAMLFPRLTAMSPPQRWAATWRAVRWMAVGLGAAAAALAAVGRPAFELAFGDRFVGAVGPFWLLLPGLWCLSLNGVLLQHLAAGGMPWFAVFSTGAAAAMNLGLNGALIPRFGIEGAAAASSLTYALLLCTSGVYMVLRGRPRQASPEPDGRTH